MSIEEIVPPKTYNEATVLVTAIHVVLAIAAAALYLYTGLRIGRAAWKLWYSYTRNAASFLLFPLSYVKDEIGSHGAAPVDDLFRGPNRRMNYILMIALIWPAKILWCSFYVPLILLVGLLGKTVSFILKRLDDAEEKASSEQDALPVVVGQKRTRVFEATIESPQDYRGSARKVRVDVDAETVTFIEADGEETETKLRLVKP